VFDFLFEVTSSVPWIYRGWLLMLSQDYRFNMNLIWKKKNRLYKAIDILGSLLFVILEVTFVVYLIEITGA
jgi:hypothetical protein